MASISYDHALKFLADIDPEALLRLLGATSEPSATIAALPREVQTPLRLPDLLYEVANGERRRIAHIETQTRYESPLPARMAEYAMLTWLRYRRPVVSCLLLLTPRGVPVRMPDRTRILAGDLRLTFRYRVVRLWEVSAQAVLELQRPTLLPLVPLMRSSESELEQAVQRLREIPDQMMRRELSLHFTLFSGLRHDAAESLARVKGDPVFDMRESTVYQHILQEGVQEGMQKGEVLVLRRLLESRFGAVPSWASEKLEAADLATLEAWAIRIFDAQSLEALLTPTSAA